MSNANGNIAKTGPIRGWPICVQIAPIARQITDAAMSCGLRFVWLTSPFESDVVKIDMTYSNVSTKDQ